MKELIVYGCTIAKEEIKRNLDILNSDQSTVVEKVEAAGKIVDSGKFLSDEVKRFQEDVDPNNSFGDRALKGLERALSFYIDLFRDTDAFKVSRQEMEPKKRLLLDVTMYMYDREHNEDDWLKQYTSIHNIWDDLFASQNQ